ncbi:MAG TPA: TldD/PmbA family protein [Actinomycetota bacterium]|jgi:predicted Zn-dependent protease
MTPRGSPLGHDAARAAAEPVLDFPGADAVEVVVSGSSTGLTRYARSEIIQNTWRDELRAYVRVVCGNRVASATTNQLDPDRMKATAARALEAAKASLPDEEFPGLPVPDEVGRAEPVYRFDDATVGTSAEERALAVKRTIDATGSDNAAGIYETSAHDYAVFSSTGIDCYDAYTRCVCTCLVDIGDSTGWAEDASYRTDGVDYEAVASRSRAKADEGIGAEDGAPGTYEVILEASAVGTLLEYFSYMGFGAKQVLEGESFLASRAGQDVAPATITVADDVRAHHSVGIGFDFEGVPKQRVAVIDSGRATGPVTDLRTARRMGTASTGHNSGSNEFGPYASNVVLEPGDASLEELVAGIADGYLVTRFHYVNVLDRPETLLTGMTRDGTFRIRNGELAGAVRNFRFANSVLGALASARRVGSKVGSFAPEFGAFGWTVAPAVHVGEFRFASTTSH